MAAQDPKDKKWRRRLFGALSVLLILCLASHPELRLLVPFLDAVGLDVVMALLGAQAAMFLGTTLKPILLFVWQQALPVIRLLSRVLETTALLGGPLNFFSTALAHYSGFVGQFVWAQVAFIWRAAQLGPNNSSKPTPLRGAA